MSIPVPELCRPMVVARVSAKGSHERIIADVAECQRLARRFGIPALHEVSALLLVKSWRGGGLKITGEIDCEFEQVSVISLEQFRNRKTFPVERFFMPSAADIGIDDDIDVIVGGEIDLGEIVAEAIALELDPYPRKADEAFVEGNPDEPGKN